MTGRDHDTRRDAVDASARRSEDDADTIEPGHPPGSQYEDPGTALTPSAGAGAGATGPGGTGRSDMRDIGDVAAGAGRGYGVPEHASNAGDADMQAGASGGSTPDNINTSDDRQGSKSRPDMHDDGGARRHLS